MRVRPYLAERTVVRAGQLAEGRDVRGIHHGARRELKVGCGDRVFLGHEDLAQVGKAEGMFGFVSSDRWDFTFGGKPFVRQPKPRL